MKINCKRKEKLLDKLITYSMLSEAENIKRIIEEGADVNGIDKKHGESPLHYLIGESGNLSAVKMLVENGASILKENREGITPLELAIENEDRREISLYLVVKIKERIKEKKINMNEI